MTPRLSADGYWLLAADGGVFTFGAAGYHGSVPGSGSCGPLLAVSLVASDSDFGYWVGSGDGRVWTFGDAFDYNDAYRSTLSGPVTAFAAP